MKAIIPAAGQGTRLYPHTHTKPKAMVRMAGKPILGHILTRLEGTAIDEVIIVVGRDMKDQIISYSQEHFGHRFELHFPVQKRALGLAHSVYQARDIVGSDDVLIALGDMLFENDYEDFVAASRSDFGGSIGIKQVEEPSHYGIVSKDENDVITKLVEKPDDPPSNEAISGVYVIYDSECLFDAIEHLITNEIRGAGNEFQLTDALQRMIDQGRSLSTFEVENWYDCGRPETLLEANRVLLSGDGTTDTTTVTDENVVLIPPVDLGDDVELNDCIVGPYVSIDDGSRIDRSIVRDSIIGRSTAIETVNIEGSLVGDNATVSGKATQLNIGDNSTLEL